MFSITTMDMQLKNVSRELNMSFNLVMQLYIQERLLQRLSLSKYKNKFLLKGGLLLYSMNEFKGRPTKDIDFLAKTISNDLGSIENAFIEICSIDIYDGVHFDIEQIKTQRIKEDAEYEGVRIKIAGMGTRLLPVTKSQPKEMMPLGRKPCVQHIVEELAEEGIKEFLYLKKNY